MKKSLALAALLIIFINSCAPRQRAPVIADAEGTMKEAMAAYAAGDCAKSLELFTYLSATQSPGALNGLGMAQLQCGQYGGAIDSFKKALAIAPTSPDLRANLGAAFFAAGDVRSAGREFDAVLRADPTNPEAIIGKAGVLLETSSPDKALAILKQLPPASQQTTEAIFDRALILYRMGIYEDAETLLRECLARGDSDAGVYNALAITQLGLKKNSEALANINEAISREPMEGKYYYNRGNVRRAMRDFDRAIDDYGRAIAYNPDFAEAFVNRGDLLFLERDQKAGCKDLEQACKLGRCERLDSFKEMGRCLTGFWE